MKQRKINLYGNISLNLKIAAKNREENTQEWKRKENESKDKF
jgi:hypothetical protein